MKKIKFHNIIDIIYPLSDSRRDRSTLYKLTGSFEQKDIDRTMKYLFEYLLNRITRRLGLIN